MAKADALAERWRADTAGLTRAAAQFEALCAHYNEPHRHYHTLLHLTELFTHLDAHRMLIADPTAVAFAAWYHDVIYDTSRSDNEEQSVNFAAKALKLLDYAHIPRVTRMILATRNHTAPPADDDEAVFLDADFAILGAPRPRYESYVAQVRVEYGWLAEDAWRAGRLAFLTKASAASRLFHTQAFETALAPQARANIAWEMERLHA